MAGLRDLELKHLVALEAVATEGTFARAAERLGYTQSAISQQIASLERILGDRVFDRPGGPRPVELTPLGARVLSHGQDVLHRVELAAEDLERFRAGAVGRVTVGAYQSVSAAILPAVVSRLYGEHPELDLRVVESDSDEELLAQLAAGALDLSFVTTDAGPACEARPLLRDPFVLLARHGQFTDGPVAVASLVGTPMIGQHGNSCQLLNESGLRAAGCDPSYVFRTNDNGTVAAMVRSGMGVAVMPLLCVDPDDPRLAVHALEPAIPERAITLAWRRQRTLSPLSQAFIDATIAVCGEVSGRLGLH